MSIFMSSGTEREMIRHCWNVLYINCLLVLFVSYSTMTVVATVSSIRSSQTDMPK